MKRLFAIVFLCGFLIPYSYGETITYDNGDKYAGDVSNGAPQGHGTYTFASGDNYVGKFWNDSPYGHGTQTRCVAHKTQVGI